MLEPPNSGSVPSNPKLWRLIVSQAKARFHPYPSPAASHWVHSHYVKSGGKFVQHEAQVKGPKEKEEDEK